MLARLVIHDVVLIEKLNLDLANGLNVFTGETGAGKSILLDALGLALGGRSDASLIRSGAPQASIIAEFILAPGHRIFSLAEEQGLTVDNPLILRRVIAKDGKSRAFINDQPISIGLLKQFGELLLEIHGQFETHGLLNAGSHRELLDAFGGHTPLLRKISEAFGIWHEAEDRQQAAMRERDRAATEEGFLRAAVAELTELNPGVAEAATLSLRRTSLQNRERIMEALESASQSLNGERGAVATLVAAGKSISKVSDKAEHLSELLATIDQASQEAVEASNLLERALFFAQGEPEELQRIEERLFALRAVARKHGVTIDDLPELCKSFTHKLSLLTGQNDYLTALAKLSDEAKSIFKNLAMELSKKRRTTSLELQKAVMRELAPLKLEKAKFIVEVSEMTEDQWTVHGADRVLFLASTNPGSPPGLLQKIASGGELARFMLALKVVLAAIDPVPTLVFDEVDTGIGGSTAAAVGERLAQLGKLVQVLVVTHSPQVAARGTNHLRVLKETRGNQTLTGVEVLDANARREEIARMLAGTQVTNAARDAAQSLLEDASTAYSKKVIKRA